MKITFNKGFTLIELLVTVSIIGMLASVVLASLQSIRQKAGTAGGQMLSSQIYRTLGTNAFGVWHFDESSGDATDDSGNGITLTAHGSPVRSTAEVPVAGGRSVFINDSSTYFNATNGLGMTIPTVYTVSFWAKPAVSTSNQVLLDVANVASVKRMITAVINSNSLMRIGGCGNWENTYYTFSTTAWQHVALTLSGGKFYVYINGKQVNSYSGPAPDCFSYPVTEIRVGQRYDGAVSRYVGGLDEIGVYKQALNAEAVGKIFAEGAARHGLAVK